MKGNVPCGTSACCGTYPSSAAIVSGIYNYNDSSAVKASSLSARGMMSTKYRWAKRGYPYASTKPANANNLLSQTERLEIVKQKTNTCIDAANAEYYVNGVYVKPQASCLPGSTENQTCKNLAGFANNNYNARLTKIDRVGSPIVKPASSIAAKSQSDHIANLKRKCESNNAVNLPSTLCRVPRV
jgi:hypothetical protein